MKLNRSIVFCTVLLASIVFSGIFSTTVVANQQTKAIENTQEQNAHFYDLHNKLIAVIYSEGDQLSKETGESLYNSLKLLTPSIRGIPVSSKTTVLDAMKLQDLDIAIWVFPTTDKGLIIDRYAVHYNYTWAEVVDWLNPEVTHIFATGNTYQLLKQVPWYYNVFGTDEEKTDAHQLFVYTLWTLADILENRDDTTSQNFGKDLRAVTLKYFANNINDLAARTIEPESAMGVDSPATIEARKQRFFDSHPPIVNKIARDGAFVDPASQRLVDDQGKLLTNYGIDIFPKEQSVITDFILSLIPENTGLRGPIGGIVDVVLSFLIDKIGDALGIDAATVEGIVNALVKIPQLIGAISSGDTGQIKEFLLSLKPMIPLPDDMSQYFDLLVNGLFALTGDTQEILDFIKEAIDLVVPEDWSIAGHSASEFLGLVFDLGASVFDKISEGANAVDIILSVMNENIVKELITGMLGNSTSTVFGMDNTQISKTIDYLVGAIGMIVNLVATGDYKSLINDYGVPLLSNILSDELDLNENQAGIIMDGVSLALISANIITNQTIEEVLIDLVAKVKNVAIPTLSNFGTYYQNLKLQTIDPQAVDYEKIATTVHQIVQAIGAAVQNPPSDVESFKNTIIDPLLGILELDSHVEDAIKDIAAIAVAISNTDFSIGSLTNIGSMVNSLLLGLGITNAQQSNIVQMILNGIVAIAGIVKNPSSFKDILIKLLPNDFSSLDGAINQILQNLIDLVSPAPLQTMMVTNSLPTKVDPITGQTVDAQDLITAAGQAISMIMQLIGSADGNSVQGVMNTLITGTTFLLNQLLDIDIQPYVDLLKGVFGKFLGLTDEAASADELTSILTDLIPGYDTEIGLLMNFVTLIRDVFTDGFEAIFSQLTGFISSAIVSIVQGISGDLDNLLKNKKVDLVDMDIPIGIGSFSLFTMNLKIQLSPGFDFDIQKLVQMIFDLIFKGTSIFEGDSPAEILRKCLSFFSIYPLLTVRLELNDFGSGESSFINFLLSTLGLQLSFSGYGYFTVSLFSFKNGVFNLDDFFKLVEWGFGFKLTLSKTLTLLDFLTGGVGGGLNAIGKYIGLDAISITIAFSIGLDIVFRAASETQPATGTMTISLGIAFTVQLGIDIVVLALLLRGTFEVVLTFLQDLLAPTPLRVFISVQLTIEVEITLLFVDITITVHWSPSGYAPPLGHEITSPNPDDAVSKGALGGDSDGDGLSDEYEQSIPGMDIHSKDSDGDGIDDKTEAQVTHTNPASKDTDGDGLDDLTELNMGTNPLKADTDFDGLNDYQESAIIGTDPLRMDSDGDGLTDYYEVNHAYNMTGITRTVDHVTIGGVEYTDHTDPLVADTDGDGLLDGEEDTRGIHYTDDLYLKSEDGGNDGGYVGDPPLVFNGGYTHPLDADTDDDSNWQLYDGSIAPVEIPYIMDMSDKKEIDGRIVQFIDPLTGIPEEPRLVRTNPTNPDTDGDTGANANDRKNPPFGLFLNGDGYELSRNPPTDPCDGDTDDDGLIDGLEGMLRPDSNHTNPVNPDTDGDGLADMQELELGTDGRSIDTDRDGISDGEEFFRYHTNPFLRDSDFDGVEDGEEVYTYHSNPLQADSDGDGLSDYQEIFIYFSDPMDIDGDNDGLTDFEEIFIYQTDPFEADTDHDGLFDGEEIHGWNWTDPVTNQTMLVQTNPFLADSDGDSITAPDQYGQMSQRMNDYDEFKLGTNPNLRDSDQDGIQDGWEVWLGKGEIPGIDPIPLNPMSNDTDGDGLIDGSELHVANMTTLLYPYIGFYMVTPYNSSAVNPDTDADGLTDWEEVHIGTQAYNNDTDNDTLTDAQEYLLYDSSPLTNDTDGDGLLDPVEIFSLSGYDTNVNNSDSDGDYLPDGREIDYYHTDPTNADENGNGILDGLEFDSDNDGLPDGQEFYIYGTARIPGGGITNPDSDGDGLFDGFEAFSLGTDPTLDDTDFDGFPDGLEYICGTNPLDNTTAQADIQACSLQFTKYAILSPLASIYKSNNIPVIAWDFTNGSISSLRYHFRLANETSFGAWTPMTFDGIEPSNNNYYWRADYLNLPNENGTYVLEMEATISGEKFYERVTFELRFGGQEIGIVSPKDRTYSFNQLESPKIDVRVRADFNNLGVRYRITDKDGAIVKDNSSLTFDTQSQLWVDTSVGMPNKDGTKQYFIEVFVTNPQSEELVTGGTFKIKTPTPAELAVIVAVPVAIGTVAVIAAQTGVFKNPFKKEGA